MKIEVEGIDEERVVRQVATMLYEQLHETLEGTAEAAVQSAIRAGVDGALSRIVEEKLRPAVEAALAEGWQRTDKWGDLAGGRADLKTRIGELLEMRDDYHRVRRIDAIAKETIEEALKKDFGETIDKAKAAFKAQVDGVIQAKLREALSTALGIGR